MGAFVSTPAFAYGPTPTQPTITSTTTSTTPGGSMTVTGTGCGAGGTVTLTLHSPLSALSTLRADSGGSYTYTVTIPHSTTPGDHTIVATCDGHSADLAIGVKAPDSPTAPATTDSLAFTGADIFGLCLAGAALIVGGGLLALVTRRRHAS